MELEDVERLLQPEVEREASKTPTQALAPKRPRATATRPKRATRPAPPPEQEKFKQMSFYLSRSEYFAIEDKVRARKEGSEPGDAVQYRIVKEYVLEGLVRDGYLKAAG